MKNWKESSRDRVAKLLEKIRKIRRAGLDEVTMGLEKVSIADGLERDAEYIERIVGLDISDDILNDEIVTISGIQLNRSLENLHTQADELLEYASESVEQQEKFHGLFIYSEPMAYSSSGTAVYNAASIESRFQAIIPEYSPTFIEDPPSSISSRDNHIEQLSDMLKPYDPKYLNMLHGSEEALNTDSADHLSQASHSMRDLFQQILEHLAPTDVVKSQPWFEETPAAPTGVSRRSRIRYLIYGTGENVDDEIIRNLDEIADSAKRSLDLCIARAHEHDPSLTNEEVRLSIDQARFSVIRILEHYNKRRDT